MPQKLSAVFVDRKCIFCQRFKEKEVSGHRCPVLSTWNWSVGAMQTPAAEGGSREAQWVLDVRYDSALCGKPGIWVVVFPCPKTGAPMRHCLLVASSRDLKGELALYSLHGLEVLQQQGPAAAAVAWPGVSPELTQQQQQQGQ